MNYSYDEKLQELEGYLKANLNNSITEINTKKTDLILDTVDSNNYFYNLTEAVNQKTFVFLEIERVESRSASHKTGDIIYINIFIGFTGKGRKSKDNTFIAYRYESAIREAISRSRNPRWQYEGGEVGSVTIDNRALYGAMCSYSVSIL